jgi:hypothetical protein
MHLRRTWRHAALIVVIGCTILALGCGLGGVAVRQGVLTPPNVYVELGGMRVVGINSKSPECSRLSIPGCIGLEPADINHIYTLWLFQQRERASWSQPQITQLISLRIEHAR